MDVYRLPGDYADDLELLAKEKASAAAEGRKPLTLSMLVSERYDEAIAKAESEVAALHAAKDSYLAYLDSKVVADVGPTDVSVNPGDAVAGDSGVVPNSDPSVEATPIADAVAAEVTSPAEPTPAA